jgi:4-amino-4-deoxy-L-arabinose transferase-like glycosyltransferase
MKRSTFFVLCLALFSGLTSIWVSDSIFERLPHLEDEMTYLFQARMLARGEIFIQTPDPAYAYWQPFIIDCDPEIDTAFNTHCAGRRFGKYPPGWPMWLALGVLVGAPWLINALFAGLTVLLVYRFGRDVFDISTGIAAALLLTFSPAAILLSGTFMGHSAALFFSLLFVYSMWKLETPCRRVLWASTAGAALGMLLIIRPVAAAGIGAPFVLYSLGRVSHAFIKVRPQFFEILKSLLILAVAALLIASLWPLVNALTTGNPTANLYRMVWDYDRIGFGPGHGILAQGHTLHQGLNNLQHDTACYWRDLFGWTLSPDPFRGTSTLLSNRLQCAPGTIGISWLLVPLGLVFFKPNSKHKLPEVEDPGNYPPPQKTIQGWVAARKWMFLLILASASLMAIHSTYWIGAEVYSARYYFEASGFLALVSGVGFSALLRFSKRWWLAGLVYLCLAVIITTSIFGYTLPRLTAFRDYGCISRVQIAKVEALRAAPGTPILVIAQGAQNNCPGNKSPWREIGALMAITDPFLENDIILARDFEGRYRDAILRRHPGRQVILFQDGKFIKTDTR